MISEFQLLQQQEKQQLLEEEMIPWDYIQPLEYEMDPTVRLSLLDELEEFNDNMRTKGAVVAKYGSKTAFMNMHGITPSFCASLNVIMYILQSIRYDILKNSSLCKCDLVKFIKIVKNGEISEFMYEEISYVVYMKFRKQK